MCHLLWLYAVERVAYYCRLSAYLNLLCTICDVSLNIVLYCRAATLYHILFDIVARLVRVLAEHVGRAFGQRREAGTGRSDGVHGQFPVKMAAPQSLRIAQDALGPVLVFYHSLAMGVAGSEEPAGLNSPVRRSNTLDSSPTLTTWNGTLRLVGC